MNWLAAEEQTGSEQEQQASAVLTSVSAASNNRMKTLRIPGDVMPLAAALLSYLTRNDSVETCPH